MNNIKRIPVYIILSVVIIFSIIWGSALVKCEVLTNKHYSEFETAYKNNSMINEIEYFKVLKCNDTTAEVYYVSDTNGDVLEFTKQNGSWVETEWKTIWSKNGSASGAVWPYFWQIFVTGV